MSHPSTIEVPMGIGQQGVSEEILLRAAVARPDHIGGRGYVFRRDDRNVTVIVRCFSVVLFYLA